MARAAMHQGEGLAHMDEAGRTCSKCAQYLPLSDYPTRSNNNGTTSLRSECKACWKARLRAIYIKKQDELLARAAQRRASDEYRQHLDATREQRKAYKAKYRRQAGAPTREEIAAAKVARAEARAATKAARALHDGHVREWRKDKARIERWKIRNNPGYRLNVRLRVAIRKALKGSKQGRSWEAFVGYTLAELVAHLERQLPKRTTLKEALEAGWHIDHITPKSTYDLANPDELRKAWGLANLRLIPADENMRKGARVEFLL